VIPSSLSGTSGAATGSDARATRSMNQNIRAPQGIPGRDGAGTTRKAFINPSAARGQGSDEQEVETNPLRRLRDNQPIVVQRQQQAPPLKTQMNSDLGGEAAQRPVSYLNANFPFLDKLKEQEQQRL